MSAKTHKSLRIENLENNTSKNLQVVEEQSDKSAKRKIRLKFQFPQWLGDESIKHLSLSLSKASSDSVVFNKDLTFLDVLYKPMGY